MRWRGCSRYILPGELGGDPGAYGHLKVQAALEAEAELADREGASVADFAAVVADSVAVARPEVGRRRIQHGGTDENIPGNGNRVLKCLRMV